MVNPGSEMSCFYIPYYLPLKDLAFSTSTKRACAISLQEYGTLLFPLLLTENISHPVSVTRF